MSICRTCSAEASPSALYCGSCGSRLVSDAISASHDPFVGRTLNATYLIEQRIGSGGMGDVYKAIHKKLDSPVALKIVKRELLSHPAMVHRFEREARAASKLHHPNVVAVTDFGQAEDGTIFMVMEYVTGKSLARVIAEDAPMDERRVVRVAAQILSALVEAHAHDILHRDLKPENVMIEARRDASDSIKVLDFGIAKLLAPDAAASTLTQAGLLCGTPGYMSPEQLRGVDVDARSDLFSVAVVMYEMLTRRLPLEVQTPMEMLHRHLSEPIPPPSQRCGRPISAALEELVMAALSVDQDGRPATAEAMREALLRCMPSGSVEMRVTEQRLPTEVLPPRNPPEASIRRPSHPSSRAAPVTSAAASASAPTAADATAAARRTPPVERTRSTPRLARGSATPTRAATNARSRLHDPAFLKRIEERIAPLLGPVSPHLVRNAGRSAATLEEVCRKIASYLPSETAQREFLAWSEREATMLGLTPQRPSTPAPAATPATRWDPATLDRAQRDLAVHVGPLARIIVRRVSPHARDVHELYELLAREIPTAPEREAFRRSMPRVPRRDA
jgi:serine/threonine-protein kinase